MDSGAGLRKLSGGREDEDNKENPLEGSSMASPRESLPPTFSIAFPVSSLSPLSLLSK